MSRAYRNLLNIRPQLARGIEWSFWELSDQVCTCLFKNNNIDAISAIKNLIRCLTTNHAKRQHLQLAEISYI